MFRLEQAFELVFHKVFEAQADLGERGMAGGRRFLGIR